VNKGTVPELDGAFSFDSLVIINDAGKELEFDVYLAEEPEQHRRGLMFVRQMPASTGMLFVYPDDGYHSMWMKNTYISLDMLFARADGTVSSIIRDTVPQTLESKESVEPVRYVLELNGGTTRRLGIGESSRIIWSAAE
jgi:uncharacterized membrane protein (UPF0127 family)